MHRVSATQRSPAASRRAPDLKYRSGGAIPRPPLPCGAACRGRDSHAAHRISERRATIYSLDHLIGIVTLEYDVKCDDSR